MDPGNQSGNFVLAASDTSLTITDLIPNTSYNVSICAATSVGCGPPSVVLNKTDEDRMYDNDAHMTVLQ